MKPVVDLVAMQSISDTLAPGLRNEWDEYKKKDTKRNILPWYDDSRLNNGNQQISNKIYNINDAYLLLYQTFNPLKTISDELILKSFRKIYLTNENDKIIFFRLRGNLESLPKQKTISRMSTVSSTTTSKQKFMDMNEYKPITSIFNEDNDSTITIHAKEKKIILAKTYHEYFHQQLNGTWDLVISCYDNTNNMNTYSNFLQSTMKRYDMNTIVRSFDIQKLKCTEIISTFWGLSSVEITSSMKWNGGLCEIQLSSNNNLILQTNVPYQQKQQTSQTFQVILL